MQCSDEVKKHVNGGVNSLDIYTALINQSFYAILFVFCFPRVNTRTLNVIFNIFVIVKIIHRNYFEFFFPQVLHFYVVS